MRAMTRHTATYSVLYLFYVQTVRALVDYGAPVLIVLSPTQQEQLQVLHSPTRITGPGRSLTSLTRRHQTSPPDSPTARGEEKSKLPGTPPPPLPTSR